MAGLLCAEAAEDGDKTGKDSRDIWQRQLFLHHGSVGEEYRSDTWKPALVFYDKDSGRSGIRFFGAAHMSAKLSLISLLLIADQCWNRWFAEKKKRIYIDNILQICYIFHVNILPVRAAERGIAE